MKENALWIYNVSVFKVNLKGFTMCIPLRKIKNRVFRLAAPKTIISPFINITIDILPPSSPKINLHPIKFIWFYALMFLFSD